MFAELLAAAMLAVSKPDQSVLRVVIMFSSGTPCGVSLHTANAFAQPAASSHK
jgi:hypothetical protein